MAAVDLGTPYVWSIAVALGLGCLLLRVSFIQLHGWIVDLPPQVERALAYLPPAVLAALVFSRLFVPDGSIVTTVLDARVVAGGVAAVVAWRTENMLATIGVGMGVLWGLEWLVG